MIPYIPRKKIRPNNLIDVPSAWRGIEEIIGDIIERFEIGTKRALEFGVEYGYSASVLSNFFDEVVGVDTFKGDDNTDDKDLEGLYEAVKSIMFSNVTLIQSRYQDYQDDTKYDLIHIDIVHTYQDTFDCGDWALQHGDVVIFHDTESFPEVKRAVADLAQKHQLKFYNYPYNYGLGILCIKSRL